MPCIKTARPLAALALAGALAAAPAHAQRQPPPEPMPARPLAFPAFRETTLPNGLRLIVVENHAHPVASVSLLVGAGTAHVPAAQAGLANVLGDVLTRGTRTRSATQLAEAIERTGGRLSAGTSTDYTGIYASVLSENLPLAMELVADVAQNASLPDSEVVAVRDRAASQLRQRLADPGTLANRRLIQELYGSHPYGRLRTAESLATISRPMLEQFYRTYFRPGNALMVVAGDVRAAEVEAQARRWFGGWTRGEVPRLAFTGLPAPTPTRITLVNRPGAVQSSIRIGRLGVLPASADYPALTVMNKVLGGGSDARLFNILREQHGWTYGAYSDVDRPVNQGRLLLLAETRTAVTDSAVAEMLTQIRRLTREPVSATEMAAAKGYMNGSFPIQILTAEQVAGEVAITRLLGLPIEDLLQRRERVAAVTPADIQRVATRYLKPDSLQIVVVGDAAQLVDKLRAIAPVDLVDAEGRPIDASALTVRASTERFDASRLAAGVHEYRVTMQGNPVGTAAYTLARDGDGWKRSTAITFGPMRQSLEARFGNAFEPREYRETYAGPFDATVEARVVNGRITGNANLPQQMGGPKTYDASAAGAVWSGMDELMLSTADLAPGKTIVIPVFNSTSGSVAPTSYKIGAAESVTVPAGTFQAYRVDVTGGSSPMTVWLKVDAPHVLVKQEIVGQPIVVELTAVR
ncbi:MAG TPA: insulinase family protein [Longimicrobium sp.]|uniref:insulinase family protein n=1 Tax=Longimicrobium sp. TaxID=2029185 RepID=UPI002EDB20ED